MSRDLKDPRRAAGVYYTPAEMVDAIVEQSLGPLVQGWSPANLGDLRVLDPACGEGAFLLGIARLVQRRGLGSEEPGALHRALRRSVFGVDVDARAVAATRQNLHQAIGGSDSGASQWQENIRTGNALVGQDFRAASADLRTPRGMNPFHWPREFPEVYRRGGFDVVVGNPPYGAEIHPAEARLFRARYALAQYRLDTYLLFIERCLHLLRPGGCLGLIIPNTWLTNLRYDKIRRHLFNCTTILSVTHLRCPVFGRATVDTQVVVLRKAPPPVDHQVEVVEVGRTGPPRRHPLPQQRCIAANGAPVNILQRPEHFALADRFGALPRLEALCAITQGAKPFQRGKGRPKQTRDIVRDKPFVSTRQEDPSFRPLLRGSLIQSFQIRWRGDYWIRYGEWLAEPRVSASHDAPSKIVVRQTGDSLVAALDRRQFVARDNLYTIVPAREDVDLRHVLGLLNSKLLSWYYQEVLNPEQGEALAQVKRGHLARLPIAASPPADSEQRTLRDEMIRRVEELLHQHGESGAPPPAALLQKIDALVYQLYGLTPPEIRMVEQRRQLTCCAKSS